MQLGEVVIQRFGHGEEGKPCEVRSILDEPSATLVDAEGHSFQWAQSLTRPATPDEAVAYWKAQAESWKRRAEKHGCDVVNGDVDCG